MLESWHQNSCEILRCTWDHGGHKSWSQSYKTIFWLNVAQSKCRAHNGNGGHWVNQAQENADVGNFVFGSDQDEQA